MTFKKVKEIVATINIVPVQVNDFIAIGIVTRISSVFASYIKFSSLREGSTSAVSLRHGIKTNSEKTQGSKSSYGHLRGNLEGIHPVGLFFLYI